MTHGITNNATLMAQQTVHMKRLRLFYWINKISLCLLVLASMGVAAWVSWTCALEESVNLELLSVVGLLFAVAVGSLVFFESNRLEELRLQIKEDAAKVKS